MFDAVKKPDTSRERAPGLLPRNSGRFVGSTTVRLAVSMDGAAARLAATWSRDKAAQILGTCPGYRLFGH